MMLLVSQQTSVEALQNVLIGMGNILQFSVFTESTLKAFCEKMGLSFDVMILNQNATVGSFLQGGRISLQNFSSFLGLQTMDVQRFSQIVGVSTSELLDRVYQSENNASKMTPTAFAALSAQTTAPTSLETVASAMGLSAIDFISMSGLQGASLFELEYFGSFNQILEDRLSVKLDRLDLATEQSALDLAKQTGVSATRFIQMLRNGESPSSLGQVLALSTNPQKLSDRAFSGRQITPEMLEMGLQEAANQLGYQSVEGLLGALLSSISVLELQQTSLFQGSRMRDFVVEKSFKDQQEVQAFWSGFTQARLNDLRQMRLETQNRIDLLKLESALYGPEIAELGAKLVTVDADILNLETVMQTTGQSGVALETLGALFSDFMVLSNRIGIDLGGVFETVTRFLEVGKRDEGKAVGQYSLQQQRDFRRDIRLGETTKYDLVKAKPLTDEQKKTLELLKAVGLQMVEVGAGVARFETEGVLADTVVLRRVRATSADVNALALQDMINSALDLFYVHHGYDAGERFGIQQVDVIINMALGSKIFHKVTAGGGKNTVISPIAMMISRMVNKKDGGAFVSWLKESLKRVNPSFLASEKSVLVLHNVPLYEEAERLYESKMANTKTALQGYFAEMGVSVEFLKEDSLRELRENAEAIQALAERGAEVQERKTVIQRIQDAEVVIAEGKALDFLNNDKRDWKNKTELLKEIELQAQTNPLSETEKTSRLDKALLRERLTVQLWDAIFKNNRFIFDEADTSLQENGVQKTGSNDQSLTSVQVEVPDWIDQAITDVLAQEGPMRADARLTAERNLLLLNVRYADGNVQQILWEEWKSLPTSDQIMAKVASENQDKSAEEIKKLQYDALVKAEQSGGSRGMILSARIDIPSWDVLQQNPQIAELVQKKEWRKLQEALENYEYRGKKLSEHKGYQVLQKIAARLGGETNTAWLMMSDEQFKELRGWRGISAGTYEIVRQARASLVGRANALKQFDGQDVTLYNEIVAEAGRENDLIALGEGLKEDARQVLVTMARIYRIAGVPFTRDAIRAFAATYELSDAMKAKIAQDPNLKESGEKFNKHVRKLIDAGKVSSLQYFYLQDTVKVMAGDAVAPRLQQSDPYLSAHTQLVFQRFYAEATPQAFLGTDIAKLEEDLGNSEGRLSILRSTKVSRDSVRSSRGDMIRQIVQEGNGSDLQGMSGTLEHVEFPLLVTYGVQIEKYVDEAHRFFEKDGIRSLYDHPITTVSSIDGVVKEANGKRQHLYIMNGMKNENVEPIIQSLRQRLLNAEASEDRYDEFIAKNSGDGWLLYTRGSEAPTYVGDVQEYLKGITDSRRVAFFFTMGATRGVDPIIPPNAEMLALLNSGTTGYDATQLFSRDRGVRTKGSDFVYARSRTLADAFRMGLIPSQVLEMALQIDRERDADKQTELISQFAKQLGRSGFEINGQSISFAAILDQFTYAQLDTTSTGNVLRNSEVFHPMRIFMVDSIRGPPNPYTAKELIDNLKRNDAIAGEDQLYRALTEDISGKLVDFLEALREQAEGNDNDQILMRGFKHDFQNHHGIQSDPNLGGTQSGTQGLEAARQQVISFLERLTGNPKIGVAPSAEFSKLSAELQQAMREELQALKNTPISLLSRKSERTQDPTMRRSGTTGANRPSEVIALISQFVAREDLPTIAPAAAATGAQAQELQTARVALNQGGGVQLLDPQGNRINAQTEQGIIHSVEERGLTKDKKFTDGATDYAQAALSLIRGARRGTPDQQLAAIEQLRALQKFFPNIYIPQGPDDEEGWIRCLESLIDSRFLTAQHLNANTFDLLMKSAALLAFADPDVISPQNVLNALHRDTPDVELAKIILVNLEGNDYEALAGLMGERIRKYDEKQADALRESQSSFREQRIEEDLLNQRLDGVGSFHLKLFGSEFLESDGTFYRNFTKPGRDKMALQLGKGLSAARIFFKKIFAPGVQSSPESLDRYVRYLAEFQSNPAAEFMRYVIGLELATGELNLARDWELVEYMPEARKGLSEAALSAQKKIRSASDLLTYYRSYRSVRNARAMEAREPYEIAQEAVGYAVNARIVKLTRQYELNEVWEDRARSLRQWIAGFFLGRDRQLGKMTGKYFSWGASQDDFENTLTQNTPYLNFVRDMLRDVQTGRISAGEAKKQIAAFEGVGKKEAKNLEKELKRLQAEVFRMDPETMKIRPDLILKMKDLQEKLQKNAFYAKKQYEDLVKMTQAKQRRGEALSESDRNALKNARGFFEKTLYSKETVDRVQKGLERLGAKDVIVRAQGEKFATGAVRVNASELGIQINPYTAKIPEKIEDLRTKMAAASSEAEKKAYRLSIENMEKTLKEWDALVAKGVVVEEQGESADTVAFVRDGKLHIVRSYLMRLYSLKEDGVIGDREVAMFLLPFIFHENTEERIDAADANIDWGQGELQGIRKMILKLYNQGRENPLPEIAPITPEILATMPDSIRKIYRDARDATMAIKATGKDDIGKANRDILAEVTASSLMALLPAEDQEAMHRVFGIMGRQLGQSGLYSRKMDLYRQVADRGNNQIIVDVFSSDKAIRRTAIEPFFNYFRYTFADYYFEVIEAIRAGDMQLAESILFQKYAKNRDERGNFKDESELSFEAFQEMYEWIQRAKENPSRAAQIAQEMEDYRYQIGSDSLEKYAGRMVQDTAVMKMATQRAGEIAAALKEAYALDPNDPKRKSLISQYVDNLEEVLLGLVAPFRGLNVFSKDFYQLQDVVKDGILKTIFFNGTDAERAKVQALIARDVERGDAAYLLKSFALAAMLEDAGSGKSVSANMFIGSRLNARTIQVDPEMTQDQAREIAEEIQKQRNEGKKVYFELLGIRDSHVDIPKTLLDELQKLDFEVSFMQFERGASVFMTFQGASNHSVEMFGTLTSGLRPESQATHFHPANDPNPSSLTDRYGDRSKTIAKDGSYTLSEMVSREDFDADAKQIVLEWADEKGASHSTPITVSKSDDPYLAFGEISQDMLSAISLLMTKGLSYTVYVKNRLPDATAHSWMKWTYYPAPKRSELRAGSTEGRSEVSLAEVFTKAQELLQTVALPQYRNPLNPVTYRWALPEDAEKMGSNVAYFDETKNEIVLNPEKIANLPRAEARADLTIAMVHELVHVAGGNEIAAYDATVEAMKKIDAERYATKIDILAALLALARGEVMMSDPAAKRDVIQLVEQILSAKGDRAKILEALLNRLQSEVYSIGANAELITKYGGKSINPAELGDKIAQGGKFWNKATSREHTVFVIRADDVPAMGAQIQRLKELGYAVFIFDDEAIRAVFGKDAKQDIHEATFRLVELAAVLGKTQFSLLMRDYGIQPRRADGFYSVAACITGVIKTLISEIVAHRQTAVAA
jgi:hypothetical protein